MRSTPLFYFLVLGLIFVLAAPASSQKVIHFLQGNVHNEDFGNGPGSINGAGDVDGDGFDDLIVGVPRAGDAGEARIFSGASGALLATLQGTPGVDERFGQRVGAAGDVNHDGFADVIVGTSDFGLAAGGFVYVISGADESQLYAFQGSQADIGFGSWVTRVGDFDDDGYDDLAVGAPRDDTNGLDAGAAFIYSSADGGLLYSLYGPGPDANFGVCISRSGDLQNDGYEDLLVGASGDGFGSVWLYSGLTGTSLGAFHGDADTGIAFGYAISGGQDVDGDGRPDFAIGALEMTRLYSGFQSEVLHEFGDGFGLPSIVLVPDMDGDGLADLAVSNSQGETDAFVNSVRVYSGVDGELIHVLYGDQDSNSETVAFAGDVDGNGYSDLIVSDLFGLNFESQGLNPRNGLAVVYGGGPPLKLIEHAPGVEGQVYTVTVTGATPSEKVALTWFFHSDNFGLVGYTYVPCKQGRLAVVSAGYRSSIASVRVKRVQANGTLTVGRPLNVPASFTTPGHFRIQAVDVTTCRLSNLLVVPIP